MSDLNKRVMRVMGLKGLTKTEFANELKITPAILSHISSDRNKPSVELLQKILIKYPDISAEWLLMGDGEVYKAQNITKETIIEALSHIETQIQEGVDTFIGVKALIKQQKEQLSK